MPLITREQKGSKLTIQEMDGNLLFLASSSFTQGEDISSEIVQGTGEIISFDNWEFSPSPLVDVVPGTYLVRTGNCSLDLVIVDREGEGLVFDFDASTIRNGGSGFEGGDEITIPNTNIGGILAGTTTIIVGQGSVTPLGSPITTIIFNNLPTYDPRRLGQLWNDRSTLRISTG